MCYMSVFTKLICLTSGCAVDVVAGMAVTATQLQNYLKTWDSFRDIWEMDKDIFIKRYHRMNPTVAAFDSDIAR